MNFRNTLPRHLSRATIALFSATVFLSAFLLFQVQPLISKYILPWFGGSPTVWTTCMLFFQSVLFLGYLYAHLLATRLSPRHQVLVHTAVMSAALCWLPVAPGDAWKPTGDAEPVSRILLLLAATVGVPYFVLSATGPLLQKWFSRTPHGAGTWRLYALSNIGSLLALLSFPFLVEPLCSSRTQATVWSVAFALFVLLCSASGLLAGHTEKPETRTDRAADDGGQSIAWSGRLAWLGLAMLASTMMLATTNHVCLDIATVPFLWILPLVLYLLSFILTFDSDRWYSPRNYSWALIAFVALAMVLISRDDFGIAVQIPVHFGAMFCACMVCHGELVRRRPATSQLTQFYLTISAGGAAGGLFVGLLAPLIFPIYVEYTLGLFACAWLGLLVLQRQMKPTVPGADGVSRANPLQLVMFLAMLAMLVGMGAQTQQALTSKEFIVRNFYGVLRVESGTDRQTGKPFRTLTHGRTVHGYQHLANGETMVPTAYYIPASGIGRVMLSFHHEQPRRIGVVGLGVGTLAAYGQAGDEFVFYEINDAVVEIAREHFSFLSATPAHVEHVIGDARLSLEHEADRHFDVLVLDAFSSDAIPTHLMTREAMAVWRRHVKDDGIIAFHISNRHFDLAPLIAGLAADQQMCVVRIEDNGQRSEAASPSTWMLVSTQPLPAEITAAAEPCAALRTPFVWSDEHTNLLQVLEWSGHHIPQHHVSDSEASSSESDTTPSEH